MILCTWNFQDNFWTLFVVRATLLGWTKQAGGSSRSSSKVALQATTIAAAAGTLGTKLWLFYCAKKRQLNEMQTGSCEHLPTKVGELYSSFQRTVCMTCDLFWGSFAIVFECGFYMLHLPSKLYRGPWGGRAGWGCDHTGTMIFEVNSFHV